MDNIIITSVLSQISEWIFFRRTYLKLHLFFQEGSTVIMTLKDAGKWTILDIRLFLSVGFSLCRFT